MILKGLFALFIHAHTFLMEDKFLRYDVNRELSSLYGGSLEITRTVPYIKHQADKCKRVNAVMHLLNLCKILYLFQHAWLE